MSARPSELSTGCILCGRPLEVVNNSGVCRECRLLVYNLLDIRIEERWANHPDGEHVVSERGRIARLLNVDRSHRYPRVSIAGRKVYLHAMVAVAWHGARPHGALVLHYDDDPANPSAENLRWGTHAENSADAKRNSRRRQH